MNKFPLYRKGFSVALGASMIIALAACDNQTPTMHQSCTTTATPISAVQGNAETSPLVGQSVTIEAVVTALAPALGGFFVQEETRDFDSFEATSEGLFVVNEQISSVLSTGQVVRVDGTVQENEGRTQLNATSPVLECGQASTVAASFELPLNDTNLEAYEGMLVDITQSWVVNNTHNLSRFGEIGVSTQLLFNPTHVYLPGSPEALSLLEANRSNMITLDDLSGDAPASLDLFGSFDSKTSLRLGSSLSAIKGVMDEGFNRYRVRLTQPPTLNAAARPLAPQVEGDIVIAAFNVLNLFNGDGQNGDFPTRRGAKSAEEYARQQTKLIAAIKRLNPDIIGLNEIENDGDQGNLSAVYQLAAALNAEFGSDVFDYRAYDSAINGASIANAILFRKDKLKAVGETKVLTSENSATDADGPLFFTEKSRPAITQAFSPLGSDMTFVLSVNHLKSKGSSCGENDDSEDQGNCNLTRTRAAQGLTQWLAQEYGDMPAFIIGDLNSYAQEDPIQALKSAGYTDVIRQRHGTDTYTYSFRGQLGSLDYVMANPAANQLIVSAHEWHINAAEPRMLDYNATLPNSEQLKPAMLISENEFRSSDHDPVVVGISVQ